MTKYQEILRRLEAAGAGAPKGRLYHFDAFGATLMPILQEVGVDPGTPDFLDVYNIIPGER